MGLSLEDFLNRPSPAAGKTRFIYRSGATRIPSGSAPNLSNRSHRIIAEVEIPESGAEGVLIAQGGRHGGFTLYVKEGRVVYENNFFGKRRDVLVSSVTLPKGKTRIGFEFVADARKPSGTGGAGGITGLFGGGVGRLSINGQPAGETRFATFGGFRGSDTETLDVGEETGEPVSLAYATPFRFTGALDQVTVDLK